MHDPYFMGYNFMGKLYKNPESKHPSVSKVLLEMMICKQGTSSCASLLLFTGFLCGTNQVCNIIVPAWHFSVFQTCVTFDKTCTTANAYISLPMKHISGLTLIRYDHGPILENKEITNSNI